MDLKNQKQKQYLENFFKTIEEEIPKGSNKKLSYRRNQSQKTFNSTSVYNPNKNKQRSSVKKSLKQTQKIGGWDSSISHNNYFDKSIKKNEIFYVNKNKEKNNKTHDKQERTKKVKITQYLQQNTKKQNFGFIVKNNRYKQNTQQVRQKTKSKNRFSNKQKTAKKKFNFKNQNQQKRINQNLDHQDQNVLHQSEQLDQFQMLQDDILQQTLIQRNQNTKEDILNKVSQKLQDIQTLVDPLIQIKSKDEQKNNNFYQAAVGKTIENNCVHVIELIIDDLLKEQINILNRIEELRHQDIVKDRINNILTGIEQQLNQKIQIEQTTKKPINLFLGRQNFYEEEKSQILYIDQNTIQDSQQQNQKRNEFIQKNKYLSQDFVKGTKQAGEIILDQIYEETFIETIENQQKFLENYLKKELEGFNNQFFVKGIYVYIGTIPKLIKTDTL